MSLIRRSAAAGLCLSLCLTLALPLRALANASNDTLVLYWKMDETAADSCSGGEDVCDTSGDGRHGTNSGATISTSLPSAISFTNARSLSLDGTNDSVRLGSAVSSINRNSAWTVSAWVNATAIGADRNNAKTIWANSVNANDRTGLQLFDGQFVTGLYDGSAPGGGFVYRTTKVASATADTWYLTTVVYSGTGTAIKLYVNGVESTDTAADGNHEPNLNGNADFRVGIRTDVAPSSNFYFNGLVDDVRVYKRALSGREIAEMAAGAHPTQYWKGTSNTSFEGPGNWSGSYLPDPYTRVVIPWVGNQPPTMTGAVQLAGLTIGTGSSLRVNSQTVTMNDSGTFTNYGTLQLKGTETLTNVTNDTQHGTVLVYGTGSYTGLPTGSSYYNLTLNDGLITHLKFDETTGTRAADSSGYGSSGTLIGPTISSTVPAVNFHNPRSLSFDGTNDYVDLPDGYSDLSRGMTVALWARPTSTKNWARFIDFGNGDASNNILFARSSTTSNLIFEVYDGNTGLKVYGTGAIENNVWHHYTATLAPNGAVLLYRDGVIVGRGTTNLPRNISRTINYVGRSNWAADAYFGGDMDDLRIYNRPLSGIEVAALAVGNQPATASGTVTLNAALDVNGSLTMNGGTLDVSSSNYTVTIGRSLINNGGKMSARKGTVTFDGTAGGLEILSGGQSFNAVTFNGSNATWNTRDRLSASGALTLSAGTLDASGSYVIRAGTWTQNGGTFTPRSGTVVLTSTSDNTLTPSSAFNVLRIEDPTENGLIGYWKLDEGNGLTTRDSSPYNRSGTRSGTGATWSGSSLASAIQFDNPHAMIFNGSNDVVTIPHTTALTPSAITVSAWIRPSSLPGTNQVAAIVDKRDDSAGTAGYLLELAHSSGVQFLAWYSGNQYNAYQIDLPTTSWSHVVLTQQGTTSVLYLNGVAVSTATDTTALTDYATPLRIGGGNGPFHGLIDDVRIYNRAISATEVVNLTRGRYANGSSSTSTFTLGGALSTATLALDSGNLAMSSYGSTVTNTLSLLRGNGSLTHGAGTLTLNGGLTVSGSTLTGGAGTIDVNDTVTILTGSLAAPSGTMTVSGNWKKAGGTFTHNSGTVTFDGTDQSMTGSTTFGNFTKSVSSADTLAVAPETTLTVANTLTLNGAASALLSLRSGNTGNPWLIDPQATRTVSYLDVKDSRNVNAIAINCTTGCTDSGNNTNWTFGTSSSSSSDTATTAGGFRGHQTALRGALDQRREQILARYQERLAGNEQAPDTDVTSDPSPAPRPRPRDARPAPGTVVLGEKRGRLVMATSEREVLYRDVPVAEWFAPYVATVIEEGIAQGYEDETGKPTGEFGVANPITRAEVLKMALEATKKMNDKPVPQPLNASAKDTWAWRYVYVAEQRQMSVFKPDTDVHAPATRGEVVQILLEALGITIGRTPSNYRDVPADHPHAHAIAAATFFGLIEGDTTTNGTPLGIMRPDDPMNRAEVAKLIALAKELAGN